MAQVQEVQQEMDLDTQQQTPRDQQHVQEQGSVLHGGENTLMGSGERVEDVFQQRPEQQQPDLEGRDASNQSGKGHVSTMMSEQGDITMDGQPEKTATLQGASSSCWATQDNTTTITTTQDNTTTNTNTTTTTNATSKE